MKITKTTQIQLLILVILLTSNVEAQKPTSDDDGGDGWDSTATNVSPSMAIVVIVLVLGFFITGCIFIYIQHCVVDTSTTTNTTATRGVNNNAATRGLDQSVIDSFPQFQYSAVKELKIGKGALECAVCLSEFHQDETLRLLPKCDHVFHSDCIDSWLVGHATCPVCRDNLVAIVPDSKDTISNSDEVQITIPEETNKAERLRLPRSHSTGHSLVQPVENCERFTLRLPAEVRRQLMARAKLQATSLVALPRQTSSRRGYRGDGSGSSRYGRFFGRSFNLRMGSFKSTAKVGVDHSFPPPLPV